MADYYTFDDLKKKLIESGNKYDIEKIERAYEYAAFLHEGQFRKSGEPYISHPLSVAEIVSDLKLDTDSICASLLHDVLEDCKDKTCDDEVKRLFGNEVFELVDGLTKLPTVFFEDKEEASIENTRKLFLAMNHDIRVIFIKFADRLHNMRTLNAKSEERQRMIALETMHLYAPLAHRLGVQKIKTELENLALRYLDPIGYDEVKNDIEYRYGENKDFLEQSKKLVEHKLEESGIKFNITGRVKSIYSIYKKMFNQRKSFDEIYDFYAIRIIVDSELECYTVLGLIHEMFNLMPGRFKDYISVPKPNMYRSLHTTVIGRHGIPFEVQIRTWDMHAVAEYGIAAHWMYKSGEKDKDNISEKLQWIKTLIETETESGDADEFLRPLKVDLYEDETFIFTPKGDVKSLPHGSTTIDFAYSIHSQVGNKMIGAKVNGVIVPIDTVLKNADICEIVTSSSGGPSRDWLKIVKTSEAKNKIRQWFKKEKRDENIVEGKLEIEKEFRHYGKPYTEAQKNEIIENVSKRAGSPDVDDFYNNIGYGGVSVSKFSAKLKDEFDRIVAPEPDKTTNPMEDIVNNNKQAEEKRAKDTLQSVIVDSIDNCQVRFAKCCNPLPGDSIIGFVTRGFGVSVHKYDCPNAKAGIAKEDEKDRWVTVRWSKSTLESGENTTGSFEALLQIFAYNSFQVFADITSIFADMRVQVHSMNSKESGTDGMIIMLNITCRNTSHVNSIISRLKKVKNVIDVTRGFSS
ncbi:MAG: bifunctional (p)ppGpp synthetase/guanosine-3',5'-bis(diphosphate) 3'-pyrophosphohydrolase [Clostridia bacterium]|nr:bifunctional (p)ppGpp synthetase/guanosine-3',5'-bis(diphosphate) 3'-pyrophosphohydrolase [Clostridia bacterium]